MFRENPETNFKAWDAATCRSFALGAHLPPHRIGEICRDPRVEI
jgi:hypothetical protein